MQHLVEAVDAADLVVATTREAFIEQLRDPPAWEQSHLTALAWVTDLRRRSVLLVDHRHHGWSCPGGHVEPGEHPATAAVRELWEETGIVAPAPDAPLTIGRSHGCAQVQGAVHWSFGYLFVVDRAIGLRAETGQQVKWFSTTELPTRRAADLDAVVGHLSRTDGS